MYNSARLQNTRTPPHTPDMCASWLPFNFTFVDHGQNADDFDLSYVASGHDAEANLAHVQRVVVAGVLRVRVHVLGVLPRARKAAVVEENVTLLRVCVCVYVFGTQKCRQREAGEGAAA